MAGAPTRNFDEINANKADLNRFYESRDPRSYFSVLGFLDYIIPQVASPVFAQLVKARHARKGAPVKVLDLGASYGINGALLKYPITWDMLRNRYQIADFEGLSAGDLERYDNHYFKAWPRRESVEVIAQDVSEPALNFARSSGCIDRGLAINLEERDPDEETAAALRDVDLIISTGCVGYISEKTFARVMSAANRADPPWVASFVLRMFPYDRIRDVLSQFGLVTEKFEGATFIQRRFADRDEMAGVMRQLRGARVPTAGKEDRGYLHAELFVSRPAEEIERFPVTRLVSVAAGEQRLSSGLAPRSGLSFLKHSDGRFARSG